MIAAIVSVLRKAAAWSCKPATPGTSPSSVTWGRGVCRGRHLQFGQRVGVRIV